MLQKIPNRKSSGGFGIVLSRDAIALSAEFHPRWCRSTNDPSGSWRPQPPRGGRSFERKPKRTYGMAAKKKARKKGAAKKATRKKGAAKKATRKKGAAKKATRKKGAAKKATRKKGGRRKAKAAPAPAAS
ncbi:MAG: hypothetical protein AB7I19_05555 [Planctomycetota bacterium]